jgi:hypothetical protein
LKAGRARVKRELLAETNGPHTTSELSLFLGNELQAMSHEVLSIELARLDKPFPGSNGLTEIVVLSGVKTSLR